MFVADDAGVYELLQRTHGSAVRHHGLPVVSGSPGPRLHVSAGDRGQHARVDVRRQCCHQRPVGATAAVLLAPAGTQEGRVE